jgi:hypothetical protein
MNKKMVKLQSIINENVELSKYFDKVSENLTDNELLHLVNEILNDFSIYNGKTNRPSWYSEIQMIFNKYGNDNPYI